MKIAYLLNLVHWDGLVRASFGPSRKVLVSSGWLAVCIGGWLAARLSGHVGWLAGSQEHSLVANRAHSTLLKRRCVFRSLLGKPNDFLTKRGLLRGEEKRRLQEEKRRREAEKREERRAKAEQKQQMQLAFQKISDGKMLYEQREKEMEPVRVKEYCRSCVAVEMQPQRFSHSVSHPTSPHSGAKI